MAKNTIFVLGSEYQNACADVKEAFEKVFDMKPTQRSRGCYGENIILSFYGHFLDNTYISVKLNTKGIYEADCALPHSATPHSGTKTVTVKSKSVMYAMIQLRAKVLASPLFDSVIAYEELSITKSTEAIEDAKRMKKKMEESING